MNGGVADHSRGLMPGSRDAGRTLCRELPIAQDESGRAKPDAAAQGGDADVESVCTLIGAAAAVA